MIKNNVNFCPVCKKNNSRNFFSVDNFPYFSIPLNVNDVFAIKSNPDLKSPEEKLSASNCLNCDHGYLNKIPNFKILDKLYSTYYNYPSPLKGNFKPVRDNNFIKVGKSGYFI